MESGSFILFISIIDGITRVCLSGDIKVKFQAVEVVICGHAVPDDFISNHKQCAGGN